MIPFGLFFLVLWVVLRFRLDTALVEILKNHWLRWFLFSSYLPLPKTSTAVRVREALIYLGPIFVKFGQTLSTRRDLLSVEYADELAKLQDQVPPFSSDKAVELIESSLDKSLNDVFAQFDTEPIASASLAQVHGAVLLDDSKVVVKVIRPKVEEQIMRDLRMMQAVSKFLERVSHIARRLHLVDVVNDYETTIVGELNLENEARNTVQLRQNFANSPLLYAPRVYNHLTTKKVLVMERIEGIPIHSIDLLREKGTDLKVLSQRGVETFFTQVFNHNFFHADMHPGNIFVDVSDPKNPSYIAVDCAIIGSLTEEDQTFIALNIVAFFNRDYAEIARLHVESGWITDDGDLAEFEMLIRKLCEPFFKKPLSEISFGQFLLDLFTASRRFDMEVQPQLVLLQKTLLHIEGLGRQLDPDLDLWSTAKPFMEKWMKERYGALATVQQVLNHAPQLAVEFPTLPGLLVTARRTIKRLEKKIEYESRQVRELQQSQERNKRRRLYKSLLGLGLIGTASLLWWGSGMGALLPLVLGTSGMVLVLSR